MTPGGYGGAPQGLFGPAVTGATPSTATSASGAGGPRTGGAPGPQGGSTAKGGKTSGKGKEDEKDGGETPPDLARRETGNVWGYVKPNEDPYN
jgi:hypothetical protein